MVFHLVLHLLVFSLVLHLVLLSLRLEGRTAHAGMPPSRAAAGRCSTGEQLLQAIRDFVRDFGRLPKAVRGDSEAQVRERNLASKLSKARVAGHLSAAQESELLALDGGADSIEQLLQAIRDFGRLPKAVRGDSEAQARERNLAQRLRRAAGRLSAAQEAQLAELRASEIGGLEEAEAPPDPLDPFADDAANRLEQDLLMFSNGIRTRALQRRLRRYQRYVGDPALQSRPEVQKYREQLQVSCASAAGRASYVAGHPRRRAAHLCMHPKSLRAIDVPALRRRLPVRG